MKRFICKVGIYMVVIIVIAIGLDYVITKGLQQVDDFIYQPWTEMRKGNLDYDVLILGNSRAQGHIHPAILDSICGYNSYNLGIEAYHMNMHIFKYRYCVQHNHQPEILIYQVDMRTITCQNIKRGSNSEQFLPLFYESICRHEFSRLGYSRYDLYLPLYRYFGYHTAIRQGILEYFHIIHFSPNPAYKGFKGWDRYMIPSEAFSETDKSFNATETDLYQFENFLIECLNDGIKVILVYSPIYEVTQKQLTDNEHFRKTMSILSERLGITYIDYTKNHEICSRIDYFSSPDHLNLKGVEVFTTQLAHDLDSILTLKN